MITEHARLSTASAAAEEQLRSANEEAGASSGELAGTPFLPDPAAPDRNDRTGEVPWRHGHAMAKLKSDIERLTADATRDQRHCAAGREPCKNWNLRTPLLTTIDQYARDWDAAGQLAERSESAPFECCGDD